MSERHVTTGVSEYLFTGADGKDYTVTHHIDGKTTECHDVQDIANREWSGEMIGQYVIKTLDTKGKVTRTERIDYTSY